ncbi:hypothetical protein WOLCODRAFT_167638, partial [Wolfiporia cocos MD-104 SS10]
MSWCLNDPHNGTPIELDIDIQTDQRQCWRIDNQDNIFTLVLKVSITVTSGLGRRHVARFRKYLLALASDYDHHADAKYECDQVNNASHLCLVSNSSLKIALHGASGEVLIGETV